MRVSACASGVLLLLLAAVGVSSAGQGLVTDSLGRPRDDGADLVGPPAPQSAEEWARPLPRASWRADAAWIGAAALADAVSTEVALARCAGCGEGGPLMEHGALSRAAIKAAVVTAAAHTCRRLRLDGHHGTASFVRWAITVLFGAAAASNTRFF